VLSKSLEDLDNPANPSLINIRSYIKATFSCIPTPMPAPAAINTKSASLMAAAARLISYEFSIYQILLTRVIEVKIGKERYTKITIIPCL
jgi:hypothetical protein